MANSVMKRVAASAKAAQQTPVKNNVVVEKPHRSEILKGLEHLERWLGAQVREHKNDKKTNPETQVRYAQIAMTLETSREKIGEPIRIELHAKTANTFYAYRAAVRWSALENAQKALRVYKNSHDEAAKKSAYQIMLTCAADLVKYPADAQPGLPSQSFIKTAKALGDDEALAAVKKTPSAFVPTGEVGKNDKLKDANKIQKIEGWRGLIFARLLDVKSPWIDHAAVAALTGCRPAEVSSVKIENNNGSLVITIPGAKVTENSGQPFRRFTIKNDGGSEFAHLLERTKNNPVILESDATASAFSEALKRAGRQALGEKAPPFTGYVYRHALACDLKADGVDRETLAMALGHAVTKTQAHYGRATGGKKGNRAIKIEASREIKHTHGTGQQFGRDAQNDIYVAKNFDGLGL